MALSTFAAPTICGRPALGGQPATSAGSTAVRIEPSVLSLRGWFQLIGTKAGVQVLVSTGVTADRLDAPLLGCLAGEADATTLDALAYAAGVALVFDGDLVHVCADPEKGVWRTICGSSKTASAAGLTAPVNSVIELSDATVAYAVGRCAGVLDAAIFVETAVYEAQPLVRLAGTEQTRLALLAALASQCDANVVGFGDGAFVLQVAAPSSHSFDELAGRVWSRRATTRGAALAARAVSIDATAGTNGSQAANLAAAIGASVRWSDTSSCRDLPSAAFRAAGRFSDVADVWCGLRGLCWSLQENANGAAWVLRAKQDSSGASANDRASAR